MGGHGASSACEEQGERCRHPAPGAATDRAASSQAGDAGQHPTAGLGKERSIPQRRCHPGASRNQRFQEGDAALLPSSCPAVPAGFALASAAEVLGLVRCSRRMLRAPIATPGLDQPRQRAPALPAFLPLPLLLLLPPLPAPPPGSGGAGCRGGRPAGPLCPTAPGLCPAAGGAQGQGQPAAGARRCPAGAGGRDPHQHPREGVRGRSAAGEEEDDAAEDAEDAAGRSGAGEPGQRLGVLLAAGLAGGRPAAAALRRGEIFILLLGFSPSVRAAGGRAPAREEGGIPAVRCWWLPQSCRWDGRGSEPRGMKDPRPRCGRGLWGGRTPPHHEWSGSLGSNRALRSPWPC